MSRRGKRDGLTGLLFDRKIFEKSGANINDRLKYIETILHHNGQVRHDLDYIKRTGKIYISTGPTHYETEKISEYADYINTELTHLRRACKEAEKTEESFVDDPNDPRS